MILLSLNPQGFFSYGEHGWIPLNDQGMVHLRGRVGVGKSSVFNTLCEILFGMSPEREGVREVGPEHVVNCTLQKACGTVKFQAHALGHVYRVIYLRDWEGPTYLEQDGPSEQLEKGDGYTGTSLHFERWNGNCWVQQDHDGRDLRYPKMAETWAQISRVIGMTYESFCTTAYISQNNALRFIKGKNADREEIITQLRDLKVYDEWEVLAKGKSKEASMLLAQHTVAFTALQTQASQLVNLADPADLRKRFDKAVLCLTALQEQITENQAASQAVLASIQLKKDLAQRLRLERDEVIKSIEAIARQATAKQQESRTVASQYQAAIKAIGAELGEVDIRQAADRVTKTRTELEIANRHNQASLKEAGHCETCGSDVTGQALAAHRARHATLVDAAKLNLEKTTADYQKTVLDVQERRTQKQVSISAESDARTTAIEQEAAAILLTAMPLEGRKASLTAEINKADAEAVPNLQANHADLVKLQELQADWQREKSNMEAAIQLYDQRVADRDRLQKAVAETTKLIQDLQLEVAEWTWLAKHYPRVKQLKLASVLKDLNDRIAHHLGTLTDGSTRVTLSPYRLKKGAEKKPEAKRTPDDVIYEFSMTVEETGKEGVPIQLYSGGQKQQIALALVGAFWDLSIGQGTHPNVLLLDEVIHNLNQETIEQVVRFLEDLRSRVSTLILVGHDPTFPALLDPDKVWTATMTKGMTTLQLS